MKTLHLDLKLVKDNYVELRYFFDKPNDYKTLSLPLGEIADLIELVEQDYYVRLAADYMITGRKLYNWLDGSGRFLTRLLNQCLGEGVVLAIATAEKLAHLPWEILHDGNRFLVERMPAIVPVRWVSSDTVKKLSLEGEPENRALSVLFMAASPLDVKPVLEFEAEEGRILEATARHQIDLKVEESGCLSELGYLVADYDPGYFDVFHLTGHATFRDGKPRFITETETGDANYASATDIAKELQFRLPKLIFLSGCRTGQAGESGAVPSMAEELLAKGAKAVLSWGQKVLDKEAALAASVFYEQLAAGKTVTEAVACTYQKLIENKARDWHLLRLYAAGTLPGQLVTTLRTPGRKTAPKPSVAERFFDAAGKVKVATRGSFVGRRRQLQSCLRALHGVAPLAPQLWGEQENGQNLTPPRIGGQCLGVLIHGMGGLGKSSLAARLCDRLPEFERLVWVGRVDEGSLVNKLAAALDSRELREQLQDDQEEFKFRLRRVFRQLKDEAAKPFLLVLDDFESNLEPRNQGYVLQPEAARVLEALVWAIDDSDAPYRLILTCRYDFESNCLQKFYKQPLDGLWGADLEKKCNRLSAFDGKSQVDEALQSQALRLADGNPRLLEWLDKVLLNLDPPHPPLKRGENSLASPLLGGENSLASPFLRGTGGGSNRGETITKILARLEADDRVELREQVLAKALLEQINPTLEEILRRGLVYELPVPRQAIAAVCAEIPELQQQINRAVALGLLEVSPDALLRVPRILPLKLPEDAETLHKQAAEVLYRLWREESQATTEEQGMEIHRLALLGKAEKIAIEIATALTDGWYHQSRYREAVEVCRSTLEVFENYRIVHNLAISEAELGLVKQAHKHHQQVFNLCPPEDETQKAATLHCLGMLKANSGEIFEAITFCEESLKLNKCGNIQGKAETLQCLGMLKTKSGEISAAITLYQQALAIFQRIGYVRGEAATLHQLAILEANLGQIDEAISRCVQSLKLKERIGNVKSQAATLAILGQLLADKKGDFKTGLNYLQQSLEILQRIQSPEAEIVKEIIAKIKHMADD